MKRAWPYRPATDEANPSNQVRYLLKHRVTLLFLLSTLVTFLFVSSISYYTIYSILYNKIERGIQDTIRQCVGDMEREIDNLAMVSQQLTFEGIIAGEVNDYLFSTSYAEKRRHSDNIMVFFNLMDYTNPNVGLRFYYHGDFSELHFNNHTLKDRIELSSLPILSENKLYTIYGPHASLASEKDDLVISISRSMSAIDDRGYSVYVETAAESLDGILKENQLGMETFYIIKDANGIVVYDQTPDEHKMKDYYVFSEQSRAGWEFTGAMHKDGFNREVIQWVARMSALGVLLMLTSIGAGFLILKSIYTSIRIFKREIGLMSENNYDSPPSYTYIAEFDQVLDQFYEMKFRVNHLMQEVRQKEQDKRNLEVDKLLAQINPHFLYNTLNTVQWIARTDGNDTIVRVVSSLIRLLRYNLGKEGSVSTIGQEINAVKDYAALQRVRNDYQFDVIYTIDERVMDIPIPRFILQPIVENSIYHGLCDGKGVICVEAKHENSGFVSVSVRDNGIGIDSERIEKMLDNNGPGQNELGMGIGLNYVNKTLDVYYGDKYRLHAESDKGKGVTYTFILPIKM